MPTSTSSIIGANLTRVDDSPMFPLGTLTNLSDGGQAMYVHASASALSTYSACFIQADGVATMTTTSLASANARVGFAQTSIGTSKYGWVQLGGQVLVNCAAQCQDNVPLFTTSTPGVLDDTIVSNGYVIGLTPLTTISNATAVTCLAAAQVTVIALSGGA